MKYLGERGYQGIKVYSFLMDGLGKKYERKCNVVKY